MKRYGARLLFMYSFSAGALKGQKEHKFLPFFSSLLFYFPLISFFMFLNFMFLDSNCLRAWKWKDKRVEWQWWWWWWWWWCGWSVNGKMVQTKDFLLYIHQNGNGTRKGKSFYFYVNVFHCLWTMSLCMLSFFSYFAYEFCVYMRKWICICPWIWELFHK